MGKEVPVAVVGSSLGVGRLRHGLATLTRSLDECSSGNGHFRTRNCNAKALHVIVICKTARECLFIILQTL